MSKNFHKIIPSWLLITAAVFVSLVFCIIITSVVLAESYKNRIMPGVYVGDVYIGGDTPAQARQKIEEHVNQMYSTGLSVRFKDQTETIPPAIITLDPDTLVPNLIPIDIDETLRRTWMIGRSNSVIENSITQLRNIIFHKNVFVAVSDGGVQPYLETKFARFNQAAENAQISFDKTEAKIIPEKKGEVLNFDKTVKAIMLSFAYGNLKNEIVIESKIDIPEISAAEAQPLLGEITDFLDIPTTELWYKEKKWLLKSSTAKDWLGFIKVNNKAVLALDNLKIKDYLEKEVAPQIDHDPQEARLAMEGNRVSVWQSGQDGLKVDLEETAKRLAAWSSEKPEKIEVAVLTIAGGAADASAEELGLKEIIGTGISQFTGSPANRRHNIRTGADTLHGLLIKPGEEFSLLKALGEIDGQHGYLQELVIKEGKTIPEYGGGLCQIGTTMFRATFNSGLPVTVRRNHSYRVVYYEPAGTDATIYNPAPDYRFINDTGHYILIQSRIEGNQLAFDFWGTKDGREIKFTKPVVYNIVSPGPTKIVETTDLPEGKKKCTESAHAGADAYFDYKVTYPNGEIKEQRFSSHYVPWQAVCLVGVKKTPEGTIPPAPTGTITPSATPKVQ